MLLSIGLIFRLFLTPAVRAARPGLLAAPAVARGVAGRLPLPGRFIAAGRQPVRHP
jgi:hypothetical protein